MSVSNSFGEWTAFILFYFLSPFMYKCNGFDGFETSNTYSWLNWNFINIWRVEGEKKRTMIALRIISVDFPLTSSLRNRRYIRNKSRIEQSFIKFLLGWRMTAEFQNQLFWNTCAFDSLYSFDGWDDILQSATVQMDCSLFNRLSECHFYYLNYKLWWT